MACLLHTKQIIAAVVATALLPMMLAQSAPAPSPIFAPPPAEKSSSPTAPKKNRPVSSEVAAALAAASPKYTPPPPKPEPKPEEAQPDLRDIDKPKNTIVR